jgi:hypothetical protein
MPSLENVGDCQVAWMPRWQNLEKPHAEKFAHGYSVYPWGGCSEYPWYAVQAEGFGSTYKREVKRRYPTPISFSIQAPSLPSPANYMDLDPKVTDRYGIPVARMHFQWHENELAMFQHSKEACKELLHAAGGVVESARGANMPGWSLHETGTRRMGNDRNFVTNRFGQTRRSKSLRATRAFFRIPPTRRRRSALTSASDIGYLLRTSTSGCIDVRNRLSFCSRDRHGERGRRRPPSRTLGCHAGCAGARIPHVARDIESRWQAASTNGRTLGTCARAS